MSGNMKVMTNIEALIKNTSERISIKTQIDHIDLFKNNYSISLEIQNRIDLIQNKTTFDEIREGHAFKIIRVDSIQAEWEATFSAVNMASVTILESILEGLYLQSICLIRQEYEGIAQLHHIIKKTRQKKKAPNIGHMGAEIRTIYAELSQGAHIASDEMAQLQAQSASGLEDTIAVLPHGINIAPSYSKEVSESLIKIHMDLRRELISHLDAHIARNFQTS